MTKTKRFHTDSRTAENFTEPGLNDLTGQPTSSWYRYIIKELLDNSLEAIKDTDADADRNQDQELAPGPTIEVTVEMDDSSWQQQIETITVSDNGPGISEPRLHQIFGNVEEFGGTKRHYSLPTRGTPGNALMTILGIQSLVDKPLQMETRGESYRISADTATYQDLPTIRIESTASDGGVTSPPASVATPSEEGRGGCAITVYPEKYGHRVSENSVRRLVGHFAALNPQATIRLTIANAAGEDDPIVDEYPGVEESSISTLSLPGRAMNGKATWFGYNAFIERLKADRRVDPSLPIEEFVREFLGLSSKTKSGTVLAGELTDLQGAMIRELFDEDGHLREGVVSELYSRMVGETRAFSPSNIDQTLGSVGPDLVDGLLTYAESETGRSGRGSNGRGYNFICSREVNGFRYLIGAGGFGVTVGYIDRTFYVSDRLVRDAEVVVIPLAKERVGFRRPILS